ncbi:uncharacterized protein LOC117787050 [Drosophila innubila]|uniref:uncharacterized protein LOC117787050 n=1 Tax=Drosophila innubila TaxID=198719 RepID=UPI00148DC5F8|nr:uncharacterized protein LOC117787050 [Drosophila innubila]
MKQTFLAANCILLAVLYINSLVATAAVTTVRPYKFGFTIEEQQHRREQRDENGIVMGEFGFITADGKYHVTVYATDENGKFRIISMKSFPYAGPVAPSTTNLPVITSTTGAPLKKHNFNTVACSGCFLTNSAPAANGVTPVTGSTSALAPSDVHSHKTEIRPLSQSLSPAPAPAADPGKLVAPTQFFQSQANKLAQLAASQLSAQRQGHPQGQPQGLTHGQSTVQSNVLPQGQPQVAATGQAQAAGFPTGPLQGAPTNGLPQRLPHDQSQRQAQSQLPVATAGQAHDLSVSLSQGQSYGLPNGLPPVNLPQGQLQEVSAGQISIDKGINLLLPFKQSIVDSIDAALAESQAHPTLQQTTPQHTTPTQHVSTTNSSNSQPLHTLLSPNTFPTNSNDNSVDIPKATIDLTNVQRIPAAQTGVKDLNTHAFGTPVKASVGGNNFFPSLTATQQQQLQQPSSDISPTANNNGLVQAATTGQRLPANGQLSGNFRPEQEFHQAIYPADAIPSNLYSQPANQPLHTLLNPSTFDNRNKEFANLKEIEKTAFNLANAQRIPAAATGVKDLNDYLFGTPVKTSIGAAAAGTTNFPSLTATQKQQLQQPASYISPTASNSGLVQTATSAQANLPANGQFVKPHLAGNFKPEADFHHGQRPVVANPNTIQNKNEDNGNPKKESIYLTNLHKIPAATTGAKDLDIHVFGSPTKLSSSKGSQHGPHSVTSPLPHSSINSAAVNPLKINVEHSMQKLVIPVTHQINKVVAQHRPQTATPTHHTLNASPLNAPLHAKGNEFVAQHTPLHTHSNTHTASHNRPLSTQSIGAVGNAAGATSFPSLTATQKQTQQQPATNNGFAQTPTSAKPTLAKSPNLAVTATKTGTGQTSLGKPSIPNSPALATTSTNTEAGQTGDLYKFKYLLDYNGHEETGSRNGNKEGNYFAIGEDAVARTIEYIANEFGFQPHISWRKLDQNEIANLPAENSLKHYEFKWFNKASE